MCCVCVDCITVDAWESWLINQFRVIFGSSSLLIYSIEQSPWEINRFSASQEIPLILWNQRVHNGVHKSPPLVPVLSQINPVHAPHPTSWRSSLILSSDLRLDLPSGPSPSSFPTKTLYASPLSPIRATCLVRLILLDFIPRIIFVEQYRSLSSSLCSFLNSSVISSLLGPNSLLSALFSFTLNLFSTLNVSNQVSHRCKTKDQTIFLYILIILLLVSKLEVEWFYTE